MAVEDWGIGKPDFVEITTPTRTEVQADSQEAWDITFEPFALPPNSIYAVNFYAVPANRYLIIGYVKLSSSIDFIGYGSWLINGNVRFPLYSSQKSVSALPDTSGIMFEEGTILGVYGENPLDVAVTIAGDMSGFLYRV